MVPSTIIAGDTLTFSVTNTIQEGFTATFRLTGPNGPSASTYSDPITDGEVTVAASTTQTFIPGRYQWVIVETDGSEVFTLASGDLCVVLRSDLQTNQNKSHAAIALENIEAVLEDKATFAQQSYSIKGRSLSRHSLAELIDARKYYKELVLRENGRGGPRQLRPRFING